MSDIYRNDFKNIGIIKEGNRVKKLCKQVRDQIVNKQIEDTTQGLL